MRIFSAVRHAIDPGQFYGALWSNNFHPALRRLGHEVVESQVDLLPGSRFMDCDKPFTESQKQTRSDLTHRIVDEIRDEHQKRPLDLILSYFYNSHFDPAGFDDIRALGIPTVNFYCNSIHQFELVREVAAAVDFAWHAERDAEVKYKAVDANPIWVQMGADPEVYHPIKTARKPTACFVGQCYADRPQWVASLIQSGIPVEIHGAGWQPDSSQSTAITEANGTFSKSARIRSYAGTVRTNIQRFGAAGGANRTMRQVAYRCTNRRHWSRCRSVAGAKVPFPEMLRKFSESEVVLNFSNVWADGRPGSQLIPHVRLRDFEAPMCRSCYLTGDTDEIREFFDVGREIDTYRTAEELIDKTRFYLTNPDAAERLRQAGYQRALADHTWERRFQQLFNKIGLHS